MMVPINPNKKKQPMNKTQISELENILGITFNDPNLFINAFVHRSYLNENRGFNLPSNERLEFLGDACLELIVSEYLYRTFPDEPEGILTSYRGSLVNTQSLAESARQINLGKFLLLSRGEEAGGGRDSDQLLANTFEAVLGAMYLDQGYSITQQFVTDTVITKLQSIIDNQAYKDAKSKFQELTQAEVAITPAYEVLNESGPDHEKIFTVGVKLNGRLVGQGAGPSKQKAEIAAAQDALDHWDEIYPNLLKTQ